MTICAITGKLRDLTGAILPNTLIDFVRDGVAGQDGSTIVPKSAFATSDGSGVITVNLYGGNYTATISLIPTPLRFSVAVPNQATAVLSDLVNAVSIVMPPQAVLDAQAAATAAAASAASIDVGLPLDNDWTGWNQQIDGNNYFSRISGHTAAAWQTCTFVMDVDFVNSSKTIECRLTGVFGDVVEFTLTRDRINNNWTCTHFAKKGGFEVYIENTTTGSSSLVTATVFSTGGTVARGMMSVDISTGGQNPGNLLTTPTITFNTTSTAPGTGTQITQSIALGADEIKVSSELALVASGATSAAHGLAATPKVFGGTLVCQTAELTWAVGDHIEVVGMSHADGANKVYADATNVTFDMGSPTILHFGKTGSTARSLTPANWKVVLWWK